MTRTPSQTTSIDPEVVAAERLFRGGQLARAEDMLQRLTSREGAPAKAFELLAYIRGNQGRMEECADLLRRAAALPDCPPEVFFYLGRVQLQRGEFRAAIDSFEQSIRRAGPFFEALHELGVAHTELQEHDGALRAFRAAELKNPNSPTLLGNLGNALASLRRYGEALACYDRALKLDAQMAGTWTDRGFTLDQLGRQDEALDSYRRALAIQPDFAPAWLNQATTLWSRKRYPEAIESFEALLRIDPRKDYVPGYLLHLRMMVCDWKDWDAQVQRLVSRIEAGERAATPFVLMATPASSEVLLASARIFAQDHCPPQKSPPFERPAAAAAAAAAERRIRVGYFSSDFREHATSQLMARLFECHDRTRFEWFGYSLNARKDAMTARVAAAFDHFVEVGARTDLEIARMARADDIDIAIDLNGFTSGYRSNIFAHRAAPVQINYLGFPGSMGCGFMDYLIADRNLIAAGEFVHYAEQIVLLPDCYQPNDDERVVAQASSTREALGLPPQAFVFACFNNNYKITPDVFDIWMRLLSAVPDSVLWLFKGNDRAKAALEHEAQARGVDPARIVWAARMSQPDHLERHRHADLFLDTFHYNAHTTCSDALWTGLPVLTLAGATLPSRVGASLLHAIGMPELVTHRVEDYERLAIRLATSRAELAALRDRLIANRRQSPLFDTPRFARQLEAAYAAIWQRCRAGLPPTHLQVGPTGVELVSDDAAH